MQDFEDIYSTNYVQIYGFLLKLCQDEMLAEELTQETFLRCLRKSSPTEEIVSSWCGCVRLLRIHILNILRKMIG